MQISQVYNLLPEEGRYHLSTLMYPAHRRQVLEQIRTDLKAGLPVRLVSTSLIEAGVDVDFPCVMREISGLDSILQAAGRCNREEKRSVADSQVYIFKRSGQKPPASLAKNIGAFETARSEFTELDSLDAIATYFTELYRFSGKESMDRDGVVCGFTDPGSYRPAKKDDSDYSGIFPFATVAKRFHFIHGDTRTVYIQNDQSRSLLEAARNGWADRTTYRKLGQYSVSLMRSQYDEYVGCGYIERLDDGSGILTYEDLYLPETGLELNRTTGEGLFV